MTREDLVRWMAEAGAGPKDQIPKGYEKVADVFEAVVKKAVENERAVNQELVGALEELISIVKIHSNATGNNFAWAELECARAAIAKARGESND